MLEQPKEQKCGGCGLERALNDAGKCGMCAGREEGVIDDAVKRAAAMRPFVKDASNAGPEATVEAPKPLAPDAPVARMVITMLANGDVQVEGPLHDRSLVRSMLSAAHDDVSYEFSKQRKAAEAAAATAKPPKRWSREWFREQFKGKNEAQRGGTPGPAKAS